MGQGGDQPDDQGPDGIPGDVPPAGFPVTRRTALGTGAATVALPSAAGCVSSREPESGQIAALPVVPAFPVTLRTTVNGRSIDVVVDARTSLLDLLRDRLALTGAKKGCDHGSAARARFMWTDSASCPV